MIEFAAAILVFLAAHVLPATTGLRGYLILAFGRRAYLVVYSLVSLLTLAWVIVAALGAPYIELWPPGPLTAAVPLIVMLPACLFFAAAATRANPLSVAFVGGPTDPQRPGLLAITRHPILWAFLLWSAGHLVANGDLVALILFGAFAVFSLMGMGRLERRAKNRLSADDFSAAMAIARGPLLGKGGRLARAASRRTGLELVAGILLYGFLMHVHEAVIGVDPLAFF